MACGGHPLPLLRRADGSVTEAGERGTLIGVLPASITATSRSGSRPGDALLLVTDGVTEARRGSELFGDARVADVLRTGGDSADAVVDDLLGQVLDYQAGSPRDDIAIVTLRVPTT